MLFVALGKARPGTLQQRIVRRMAWQVPQVGAEIVGEYWLQTPDPAVILVFNADNVGQMSVVFAGFDDLFDISIYPATTAQAGLEFLKQMPRQ